MTISIQLYRLRTGAFLPRFYSKFRNVDIPNAQGRRHPFLFVLIYFFLTSPITYSQYHDALPQDSHPGHLQTPVQPQQAVHGLHHEFQSSHLHVFVQPQQPVYGLHYDLHAPAQPHQPVNRLHYDLSAPAQPHQPVQGLNSKHQPYHLHAPVQPQQPVHGLHHDNGNIQLLHYHCLNWSYASDSNQLAHSISGNRRLGYKISFWNCRCKLINQSGSDTNKLVDIKKFIERNKPLVFGIIESDLYSPASIRNRCLKLSTSDLKEKLKIEGYNIELPDTWTLHGQARVIVYVSEDLVYKVRPTDPTVSDIPNITLDIGIGREKKTVVNIFYREWTGGVSGESSHGSQIDRFTRQIQYWKSLYRLNRNVIILGDANLDAKRWNDLDYNANLKVLSNLLQDHLLEESSHQIVQDFTRSEMRNNSVHRSLIDHMYTNVPMKCEAVKVEAIGDSDHLGVTVSKYSKEIRNKTHAVLKRNYKNFVLENFLSDIHRSNINAKVLACENLATAASVFEEKFLEILDFHAPIKIFQTRKNYVPYLSEETKMLMRERDTLKKAATERLDEVLMKEFKKKRNEVKNRLKMDETKYHKERFFDPKIDVKKAWKYVYNAMGISKNNSPSKLSYEDKIITNPKEISEAFNKIFKDKL